MGRRQLPLCPVCDADAIADSETGNRPVPESYVSVFLFGRQLPHVPVKPEPVALASSTDARPAEPRTGRSGRAARAASAPGTGETSPAKPTGPARTRPSRPKEQSLARPTVRQAIEAYLSATPAADSLAMLFLGQHLGPASRLDSLDQPGKAESLQRWFDATWDARQDERRRAAAATITEAVDHWRAQGWLTEDLAAELR